MAPPRSEPYAFRVADGEEHGSKLKRFPLHSLRSSPLRPILWVSMAAVLVASFIVPLLFPPFFSLVFVVLSFLFLLFAGLLDEELMERQAGWKATEPDAAAPEATVADDGFELGGTFLPWSQVLDVISDRDGVVVWKIAGDPIRVNADEPLEFLSFAKQRLEDYRIRAESQHEVHALNPLPGESEQEGIERIENLTRDSGYRGSSLSSQRLLETATDPSQPHQVRVTAARVLVRVAPHLVDTLQQSAGQTASPRLSRELSALLDE